LLRNQAILVGVDLLEGLHQSLISQQLRLLLSGKHELMVVDSAVIIKVNVVEDCC